MYEIGRVFRNEGVSTKHSPEFSLVEFYEAYSNLEDIMRVVEDLFRFVAEEVFGSTLVHVRPEQHPGEEDELEEEIVLDFGPPWQRVDLLDAIRTHSGVTRED